MHPIVGTLNLLQLIRNVWSVPKDDDKSKLCFFNGTLYFILN